MSTSIATLATSLVNFRFVILARTLKPIIEEPDVSRRTVSQGRSVKFDCKVTSVGQVEFNWKWFDKIRHSSVDLKTSKQFGSKYIGNYTKTKVGSINWFYFDGFLVIKDVTKKDEGKYTCIVKSNHGSDEMDFHLYVRGKGEGENTVRVHINFVNSEVYVLRIDKLGFAMLIFV